MIHFRNKLKNIHVEHLFDIRKFWYIFSNRMKQIVGESNK